LGTLGTAVHSNPALLSALGLIYVGAFGPPRLTTSLCVPPPPPVFTLHWRNVKYENENALLKCQ
jgi:hypothetical protein